MCSVAEPPSERRRFRLAEREDARPLLRADIADELAMQFSRLADCHRTSRRARISGECIVERRLLADLPYCAADCVDVSGDRSLPVTPHPLEQVDTRQKTLAEGKDLPQTRPGASGEISE